MYVKVYPLSVSGERNRLTQTYSVHSCKRKNEERKRKRKSERTNTRRTAILSKRLPLYKSKMTPSKVMKRSLTTAIRS